jgi:hypothetical protein
MEGEILVKRSGEIAGSSSLLESPELNAPSIDGLRCDAAGRPFHDLGHPVLSVNTEARFDTTGKQTNTQFGQITATRSPRVNQLALTFSF